MIIFLLNLVFEHVRSGREIAGILTTAFTKQEFTILQIY